MAKPTQKPTADFVRSILDYDPLTGIFRWRYRPHLSKKWNTRYAGTVAGHKAATGYVVIQIGKGANYPAHQLAWLIVYGEWAEQLDHRFGIRDDNRISEIRRADDVQNSCNKCAQSNNTSGVPGVTFHPGTGKWRLRINHHGRRVFDGLFDTLTAAKAERLRLLPTFHGEFARIS